ncbi:MAG: DRTGG domain-containing protein [Planctomycetota bacterium]|jgi:predicted transcriptional regulator
MTLAEIVEALDAEVLCGEDRLDVGIASACASDLMSDVLAFMQPRWLLLTSLANLQVVRTAEMAELSAVCFVRGKKPDEATVDLAREKEIPLITTKLCTYDACVRLHTHGLTGCSEEPARPPAKVASCGRPGVPSRDQGNR